MSGTDPGRAITGAYTPSQAFRRPPPDPADPLPPSARRCASCGADIIPFPTGWGTNWVRPGGNGLCRMAANGVHFPPP